uniref:Uncharacterized protein n=1 Tax=Monopterus albus TaxID=43700 RepID=A0A3Q3J9B1_MONAL
MFSPLLAWVLSGYSGFLPVSPSLIDRRGLVQSDTPQTVSQSNETGASSYTTTQLHSHMAAATPLLHSDPMVLAHLPGKTATLGGACAYLAPTQPSLPSCGGDVLVLRDPQPPIPSPDSVRGLVKLSSV